MIIYKRGDYNIWIALLILLSFYTIGIIQENILWIHGAFALALGWALSAQAKIK
ncbi:MAG: hypothetical protein IH934_04770 [Nanoarchaeota archaeon]|nr:hypothetical protein [Nanoarchaeota archaeon]